MWFQKVFLPTVKGYWKFQREGVSEKGTNFKGKYEPKLESRRDFFLGGGGGLNKKTCIGGVWIFRVTTHNTLNGPSFSFN